MPRTKVVKPAMVRTTQNTQRRLATPTNGEAQQEESIVLPNLSIPESTQELTVQPQITNITIKDNDTIDTRAMRRRDYCVLYTVIALLLLFCIANAILTLYIYRSCHSCQQSSHLYGTYTSNIFHVYYT